MKMTITDLQRQVIWEVLAALDANERDKGSESVGFDILDKLDALIQRVKDPACTVLEVDLAELSLLYQALHLYEGDGDFAAIHSFDGDAALLALRARIDHALPSSL